MPTIEDHVDAYAAARTALAVQTTANVARAVAQFDDWYSTSGIAKFAANAARLVRAGQRQSAAVTDAYLSRVTTDMRGKRVPPVGVIDVEDLRTGVTPAGVYGRVADNYRWRITEGDEPDVAHEKAVTRAVQAAETDLNLAVREQVEEFKAERDVEEWRRVIRPEAAKYGSCGICVVAADRIYYKEDLLAMHPGCNCTVLPIVEDNDPGLRLNRDDFERIYAAAGSTHRDDLKKLRVVVREHGEIGAVLVRAGDGFRDAADVARDTRDAP